MEHLEFDFDVNYNKNTITVSLIHCSSVNQTKWQQKQALMSKSVKISSLLYNPSSLLDRVATAQIQLLSWYSRQRKLIGAIDMMVLNGKEMRVNIKELKDTKSLKSFIQY